MKKLALLALVVPVLLPTACDEGGTRSTDYASVLRTVSESARTKHAAFAGRADELATALRALESTPDRAHVSDAQEKWQLARAAYRELDAFRLGPVLDLGIAERIDVPAAPADIDAVVNGTQPIDLALVAAAPGKQKGLLGAEYLLFSANGADAALAALTGDGPAARRRTLARAIGEEIAQSAHQLLDAWTAGDRPIANELATAGAGSQRYPTQRAAMDDLVAGVANGIELVAGIRLGRTLGKNAGGTPNPDAEPAKASDSAVADMKATMSGVEAIYVDDGVHDLIHAKSAALDTRVTNQLAECSAAIAKIPRPFVATLSSDAASIEAAYTACKIVRTTWNTELASALGATLKPSDNDGD